MSERACVHSGLTGSASDLGRTLLSHEWLAPHGGSENVFEQLALALPTARRMCLWNDAPERFGPEVSQSWLASTPLRQSKAIALPFSSAAWHTVDLRQVERVVVSSHAFGHHLAGRAARRGIPAFAYIHTPARYIWSPDLDRRGAGPAVRGAAAVLKRYDRSRVDAGVSYVANSEFVRDRIRASWAVDADIIYPPVPVERLQARRDWSEAVTGQEEAALAHLRPDFVLGASRAVEYKRLDVAIRVGELLDLPVVIAGDGPHRSRLESLALESSVPVTFLGRVSDALLYALYQRASLYSFMAVEDFGIMPVEAMSVGTPVLVNSTGGAIESVRLVQGGSAVAADADDASMRERAMEAMKSDAASMREKCLHFSEGAFQERVRAWVGDPGTSGSSSCSGAVARDGHAARMSSGTGSGDAAPDALSGRRDSEGLRSGSTQDRSVTVLLPVRNGSETIADAVRSVVGELGPDDELIVIDDGSNDGTREIVAGLRGPITWVHSRGSGIVAALNTGLDMAEGAYIARCDADDAWLPGHLERLREGLARAPRAVAVFGAAELVTPSGQPGGESIPPPAAEVGRALLRGNPFIHGTVLALATAVAEVGGYREYPGAEDFDLWVRLGESGTITTIPDRVYRYRLSEAAAHRTKRRRQARSCVRILLGHAVRTRRLSVAGISRNAASSLWQGPRFWYRT